MIASPGNLRPLTTQQLIQQRLPNEFDQPWVWNELDSRLQAGSLSSQDADAAVQILTAQMTKKKPGGWDQPLSWQKSFLKSANRAGFISDPTRTALYDAFYGPKPVLKPLSRTREGQPGFEIEIKYGNPWSQHSGLDVELLWEVERVLVDGESVELRTNHKFHDSWSGHCDKSLFPGEHQVTVEFDCAYMDENKLVGLNRSELPAAQWPRARKRWKPTISSPLRVYSKDESIVPLTKDPGRNPEKTGGIRVGRCVVQADRGDRRKIVLEIAPDERLAVPLSCDVTAAFSGTTINLGPFWVAEIPANSDSGKSQLIGTITALDASITSADIILTPNPKHIEHRPEVKEIWGGTIRLQGIPLERLDLEVEQSR